MGEDRQAREAEFTRLYDAHFSAVRAYAWRRGPDVADDVVAETFTIAWQRLERVPAEPLPWLVGIARNVRRNQERSDRRRRDREMRSAQSDVAPSFAEGLEGDLALADALRRLSERDREILLLAAWERLDRAGLAMALGCSKTAAAVRLHRARKRLTWSPDGTKIAFACISTGHAGGAWDWSGLYIVKADGSGLKKVSESGRSRQSRFEGSSLAIDPVWQPR